MQRASSWSSTAASFRAALDEVLRLPGVGRSTAAAILVFCRGERRAILDGNVKRVLARAFAVRGLPGRRQVENELWRRAEALLPEQGIEAYTQGLMDLGARICTRTKPRVRALPGRVRVRGARPRARRSLSRAAAGEEAAGAGNADAGRPRPRIGVARRSVPRAASGAGFGACPKQCPMWTWSTLCKERFGVRSREVRRLDPIRHGFTHFRLTIHPVIVEVAGNDLRAAEPGLLWLQLDEALGAALPAPVKTLLASLQSPSPRAPSLTRAA